MIDSRASSNVTGSADAVNEATLVWDRTEKPRLPDSNSPSQLKNCVTSGWSMP